MSQRRCELVATNAHPKTISPYELAQVVHDVGRRAGLDAVGIATAEPLSEARRLLHERKAQGLHAGMRFTYKNPDRSTDPQAALAGARSVVVGALRYSRADPVATGDGPTGRVARYAWGDRYAPLRVALHQIADALGRGGFRTLVLADDNSIVDRAIAHRAGIGWFGRNANLLLPGQGSWFVLGSVLTTAPLPPAPAPVADACGTCRACEPACPTGAIVAPGVIDAGRCLAWLVQAPGVIPRQFRAALGDRVYGCDDCQEVCPPNRIHDRREPPSPPDEGDVATVDLLEWLELSDAELMARHGRWYIAERDPRHLRRNAIVALGNVGRADDPRVVEALRGAVQSSDALLRSHGVWALGRLGLGALVPAHDDDPTVAEEIGLVRAEMNLPAG